jgi:hypothetical protein
LSQLCRNSEDGGPLRIGSGDLRLRGCDRRETISREAHDDSFVRRHHELAELKAPLPSTRLLTLAGTGGVGKTRLALEMARATESSYPGGTAAVELAALADAALVADAIADAIAAALDVRAMPDHSRS